MAESRGKFTPLEMLTQDIANRQAANDAAEGKVPKADIAKSAGFPMTPPGSNPAKMVGGVRDVPKGALKPLPQPVDDQPDATVLAKKGS